MWPAVTSSFGLIALVCLLVAWQCLQRPLPVIEVERPPLLREEEKEDELELVPARFEELPGWRVSEPSAALSAFSASCRVLLRRADDDDVAPREVGGTVAQWRQSCARAASLTETDEDQVRSFFEAQMRPYAVTNRGEPEGFFTGYFEPSLRGSRRRSEGFDVPIYRRPPELVSVNLGLFRDGLRGERLAGRVVGGRLEPYPDRAAIEEGALAGRRLELAWVDDPIDAFFLHVQGSGRIELVEGGFLRVGYAGQNGHPYFAIGRELVQRGEMSLDEVSLQSICGWLKSHPDEAQAVMRRNASFVFFRELEGPGPVGTAGVVLTPGRSLAVDRRFLPLGAPIWIEVVLPAVEKDEPERVLRRLVVAQDTGGAIRGPARGDLFWGHGDRAAAIAGPMKHPGRMWILLPRSAGGRAVR